MKFTVNAIARNVCTNLKHVRNVKTTSTSIKKALFTVSCVATSCDQPQGIMHK
jgi:hypothetical protein